MKSSRCLFIAFTLSTFGLSGQLTEELKAPSMPAATLIGSQVNEVTRPMTLQSLEASLLNNFLGTDNNVVIPDDYALEFNIFMLTKQKNKNYSTYLDNTWWRNMGRYSSLSIATNTKYAFNDTISGQAIGFGYRTIILNGKADERTEFLFNDGYAKSREWRKKLVTIQSYVNGCAVGTDNVDPQSIRDCAIGKAQNEEEKELIRKVFEEYSDPIPANDLRSKFDEVYKRRFGISELRDSLRGYLDDIKTKRYGFRWELDFASALAFPNNALENGITPRTALWSNFTYRPAKDTKLKKYDGSYYKTPSNFEFIGMVRGVFINDYFVNKYRISDTLKETGVFLDLGVRAVYEVKRFSFEVEYVYRVNRNRESIIVNNNEFSRSIIDDSYKLMLNVNYRINDNIMLSYNFGKNYNTPTVVQGDLISGFTLNFGFGQLDKDDVVVKQ